MRQEVTAEQGLRWWAGVELYTSYAFIGASTEYKLWHTFEKFHPTWSSRTFEALSDGTRHVRNVRAAPLCEKSERWRS